LDKLASGYSFTSGQTESDLQALLAAAFIYSSPVTPGTERPAGFSKKKIDLVVPTDTHLIVVEIKTLSACITGTRPSQSLQLDETIELGLTTARLGELYPQDGLDKLMLLTEAALLCKKVTYSNTTDGKTVHYKTVQDVHTSAEDQVKRYATHMTTASASDAATRTVLGFAVTQVINRFIVTNVAVV
jgi:hypothetical protein